MSIDKFASDLAISVELARVIKEIDEKLTKLNIPHVVIGGIAVGKYSKPRTTVDADFLVKNEDLVKIKQIFQTSPLLMDKREGITTKVNGIDVDFISAASGEEFLLDQTEDYFSIKIPGKTKLLYLKLVSGRTTDFNDVVQICKRISDSEKREFIDLISNLDLPDLDKDDILENFESCCQIAELENKQQKQATRQFRTLILKTLTKRNRT